MNASLANEYLRTKVLTASPEQLQLMLYEGAIRFARQGREALAAGQLEASCERLMRAEKIVLELNAGLRFEVDAQLCRRLSSLYLFIYRRLVQANMGRDAAAADEAIDLLEHQRQTWTMLLEKLAGQAPPSRIPHLAGPAAPANRPQPAAHHAGQSAEPVAVDLAV